MKNMRNLQTLQTRKPLTATALKSRKAMIQLGLYFGALVALFLITNVVFASSQTLGDVAANVTTTMSNVTKLITAASYVSGVGFALMGMFKFKAHKEQPTQIPLSQPIVLIAIAAGLIFLPSIITTAGSTIFGSGSSSGKGNAQGVMP